MVSQKPESAANDQSAEADDPALDDNESLTFWEMLSSTLWAVVGVQSRKNRARDFAKGKAIHFIYFGIGFTICFVVGMYLLVRFVLATAGN